MTGKVYSCAPEDDIDKALDTMQQRKVRRLPVIAPDGTLEGILSLNDVTLSAKETADSKIPGILFRDIVETYKALCAHPVPAAQSGKSTAATA